MDNNNRNQEIFDVVKNVLKGAHQLFKAENEAKAAKTALESGDRDTMIITIGKYVNKYERFINSTTFITGRWTEHKPDFYKDESIERIMNDLEFSITIVYLKTAVDSKLGDIVENGLKKLGINELVVEGLSWIN